MTETVTPEKQDALQTWAIVELMGHRRLGGFVREETRFGVVMCRIDVPNADQPEGFTTIFHGGASIYALTPCSKEAALAVAKFNQPTPVHAWEMPRSDRQLAAKDAQLEPEDVEHP